MSNSTKKKIHIELNATDGEFFRLLTLALSLQRGIYGVVRQNQTMAAMRTPVSVEPMHFTFAEKYLDNGDNRPQNTYRSSDNFVFFFFLFMLG